MNGFSVGAAFLWFTGITAHRTVTDFHIFKIYYGKIRESLPRFGLDE